MRLLRGVCCERIGSVRGAITARVNAANFAKEKRGCRTISRIMSRIPEGAGDFIAPPSSSMGELSSYYSGCWMVRTVNRAYSPAEKECFALRRLPPRPRKARPTLQFEEYLNMDANLIEIGRASCRE